MGPASQFRMLQIVYPGGNWCPRDTALRRLAWELHKRTSVTTALEPSDVKPTIKALSQSPIAYLSGDRSFPEWSQETTGALSRFLRLGGTLIVDPAYTEGGDAKGFDESFGKLVAKVLPEIESKVVPKEHVLYRSFYDVKRPVGRIEGPANLSAYAIADRLAIVKAEHDLGGAWARDNLGNWEHTVAPGGERQRENAFRLGVNIVMYSLCLTYKDEEPHQRFNRRTTVEE